MSNEIICLYIGKGKIPFSVSYHSYMAELSDEQSWTYGRMPEYLWIGLVLDQLGRKEGLAKLYGVISKLHQLAPEMRVPRLSDILALAPALQGEFYEFVTSEISKETLAPLTIFLTISKAPVFSTHFFCPDFSVEDRCNALIETMRKIMGHQTYESTDIRFVVLYFSLLSGKLHLLPDQVELLRQYPKVSHEDEVMKMARPNVRATEMMLLQFDEPNSGYLQDFWRCISEMTDCTAYAIQFAEENRDIDSYMEYLYEIFKYLSDLFVSVSPLDDKMNTLIGIATYSYQRFKEAYTHNLFNSIAGRSCVRVLIENYIMMKYLVKNEPHHNNIWRDYQLYGIGQYKLILERHREAGELEDAHFHPSFIEALVNEFKAEEFIDMDTRYFDQQNVRLKAENVGEKPLFGLYYDYDSAFEHGLWGAIRESVLLKCNNPAHQYHCIPDVDGDVRLKSVLPDCIMVMGKTITFLNSLYEIPKKLFEEVVNFELKSSQGKDN